MAYLVGAVLALGFGAFGTLVRLDRDRAFYPTILIVIALLYGLYAAIGNSTHALLLESLGIGGFITAAVFGFRGSLWLVVAGLAGHGIYDALHPHLFINPGVPAWWPQFCSAYDVVAAGYLAALIRRRGSRAPVSN